MSTTAHLHKQWSTRAEHIKSQSGWRNQCGVVGEGTIGTITVEDITEALECIWRREASAQAPSKWDPLREQMLK
jgi:hypothetical protein